MLEVDPHRKRSVPTWARATIAVGLVCLVGLAILSWRGARSSARATPTVVALGPTETPTIVPTHTLTATALPPTATQTPTTAPTHTLTATALPPTATQTPTTAPTHTPTAGAQTAARAQTAPAATPTVTWTTTPAPSPPPPATSTPRWLPAPELLAPAEGTIYVGWNAEVVLRWTRVEGIGPDEYYVVSIPYDDAGGVAEFWRAGTMVRLPAHFSLRQVGFADRHYTWSVQVRRCTEDCGLVLDDQADKQGIAVGDRSAEGLFYWQPDFGARPPTPTPTRIPTPIPTPTGYAM